MKIAINGFGRIGRQTLKAFLEKGHSVVAINDPMDQNLMGHLFKYDTVYGVNKDNISIDGDIMNVNDKKIALYSERDPEKLPWKPHNIDVVIEATGRYLTSDLANMHIKAGCKKVITTAPLKHGNCPTIVMGVNEDILKKTDNIISNASCTTNCLAPIVKILESNFGIKYGTLNTIHAFTADQRLHDGSHKDFRRARSAVASIIPTSTGATKSIEKIFPLLKGKLNGLAMRVPVINGSVIDFTVVLKKNNLTREKINLTFEKEASNAYKGILEYSTDPIVSIDIIGNTSSAILDSALTTTNDDLVKIIAWYDNETGYSNRIVDLFEYVYQIN